MKMLLFWKIQYTVYKSKSNAGFKNVMFEYLFFFLSVPVIFIPQFILMPV